MYTFEDLVEAQMNVRTIILQSGVPEDVANEMFLRNVTEGCRQISQFNSSDNSSDDSNP